MTDESFKIIGWCRDKRFTDHYSEGATRPKNATSDPNEWLPVISNDDYNRAVQLQADIDRLTERLSPDPQGGDWIDVLEDRVEGLQADLDSAVEVAYKRGATEWVRLNYPKQYERLSGENKP